MAKWAEQPYQGSVYYSLEQKKEHLRAVHNRPGPIGKFIHGILIRNGSVGDLSFYKDGTICIAVSIPEDKIREFEESTGFGLTN